MAPKTDESTELKIKEAARKVFHSKGFAGAKTRDIAEEAGINLALLNYYFRSKQKLFEIIMLESMQQFMHSMSGVFNDTDSSFEEKLELIAERYLKLFSQEPDLPIFMLTELRQGQGAEVIKHINLRSILLESYFVKQYAELQAQGKIRPMPFLQFVLNLMSFCVFPFMAAPIIKHIGGLKDAEFAAMVEERKRLIPIWVQSMLRAD